MTSEEKEVLQSVHLLYVEDEQDIAGPIANFFKRRCREVTMAANGEEGLAFYRELQPDIVVTDINMPKMDGLEMSREIKAIDPDMPIVVTTAHSDESLFLAAIDIGIDHYIIKPILTDKLIEVLVRIAKALQLRAEVAQKNQQIQQLLDFQDNLVIFSDGAKVKFCNKRVLDFFGYPSLEKFHEQHECVCDFFIKQDGFLYDDGHHSWLDYITKHQDRQFKVKMFDREVNEEKIFIIKSGLPYAEGGERIVSFTDITQFEKQRAELEEMATKDHLTDIMNRIKFNSILEFELKKQRRTHEKFSLIMLDIDFFKKVNDTYGHLVGDNILVGMTKVVKEHIREVDVFARWGGEEFVILALVTALEDAIQLAEKLRKYIETAVMDQDIKITCSFGVTEVKRDDDIKAIIGRSDEALYAAKANGRNRVEVK